jgi:hypothetical protein
LVKFISVGIYLEDAIVPTLSIKWYGKIPNKFMTDAAFFHNIYMGEHEKPTRATFINHPLYDEVESRVEYLKSSYMDIEAVSMEEFKVDFKNRLLPHWVLMAELLEEGDLVIRSEDHMPGFSPVVNNRQCCNLLQLQILLQYIAI